MLLPQEFRVEWRSARPPHTNAPLVWFQTQDLTANLDLTCSSLAKATLDYWGNLGTLSEDCCHVCKSFFFFSFFWDITWFDLFGSSWCIEQKNEMGGVTCCLFFVCLFFNTERTCFFCLVSLYKLHFGLCCCSVFLLFFLFFCTCLDTRSCGCNCQRLQYKLKCAWLHVHTGCDPHPLKTATFHYFSFLYVVKSCPSLLCNGQHIM